MATKALDALISEVTGKLVERDRRIEENARAASAAETRAGEVKQRVAELVAQREATRMDRQQALAAGEDVKDISKRLRSLSETLELCEDEVEGLLSGLEALQAEGARLRSERQVLAREIPLAKLRDAAQRYNVLAAQLGPIVAEVWALRAELKEPVEGLAVHTPRGITGALESVPRLFVPGEEAFLEVGDQERHFYFDGPGMKAERGKRGRALTVDERLIQPERRRA